jgi:hypothetical protein
MFLHGKHFILAEFGFGIVFPVLFAIINLRRIFVGAAQPLWVTLVGIWLIGIGINYIPLLTYAVIIARKGSIEDEGQSERVNVMKYSLQQFIIFIPLLVAIIALIQESHQHKL